MLSALPPEDGYLRSEDMESPQWTARRATIDDLPALEALWQRMELPWQQLEQYLTEFQVVPAEDGSLRAAIGMLVEGQEALMHTEAIPESEPEPDELRAALWKRLQVVARNQGVVRIWTQEDAPYWVASGFQPPEPSVRSEAKASFVGQDGDWHIFPLSDPNRTSKILQEQMAIWQATREQESSDFMGTIRNVRTGAFMIAGTIIALLFGMAIYIFSKKPDILNHLHRR
jgi:N-acetylglutamate synthase-like GNAT family acetyltransferase